MNESTPELTLVSLSEIARLANVRPSNVSNWRSRNTDFPAASSRSARGDLYPLADVLTWLVHAKKIDEDQLLGRLLWNAAEVTRGSERALTACLLYVAAHPYIPKASAKPGEGANDRRVLNVRKGINHMHLVKHYFRCDVDLEPDEIAALLPTFDGLESLLVNTPASRVADALIEEYSRHLGKASLPHTSRPLQRLLASLVWHPDGNTRSNHTVLDPAVGTGGLLTAAIDAQPAGVQSINAVDINAFAVNVTGLRLAARDLAADIQRRNVLTDDPFPELKADAVVVDPPYGMRLYDTMLSAPLTAAMGRASHTSLDWAWVFYASDHLTEDGRAVVLLPSGALTRGGAEADLRSEVLRRGLVEALIALPGGLAHGTAIPLTAIVLRAPGHRDRGADILMIDATRTDWDWKTDPHTAVDELASAFHHAQRYELPDQIASHMANVPLLDALAPGASLAPAHWIPRVNNISQFDATDTLSTTLERLEQARQAAAAVSTVGFSDPRRDAAPEWVTVESLIERRILRLHRAPVVKHSEFTTDGIPVLTVTSVTQLDGHPNGYIDPSDERLQKARLTERGDVVFATIGAKAVVDNIGGCFPAAHVVVIEILDQDVIDPYVLAAFLSTDAVAALSTGTTIQRVDLRHASIPLLPPNQAAHLSSWLYVLRAEADAATEWLGSVAETKSALIQAAGAGVSVVPAESDRSSLDQSTATTVLVRQEATRQ